LLCIVDCFIIYYLSVVFIFIGCVSHMKRLQNIVFDTHKKKKKKKKKNLN
jgi:hypothetical protein